MLERFLPSFGRVITHVALLAAGIAMVCASGCGVDTKPMGQADGIVATVDGEGITTNEINESIRERGLSSAEAGEALRRRVLDDLIDDNLLAKRAVVEGLDREPAVRLALEMSRRRVLAGAALKSVAATSQVSDADARRFYAANPHLFARRKIFAFHEYSLAGGNLDATVKAKLEVAATNAQVARILRNAGIDHEEAESRRAAESLAAPVLSHAMSMDRGDILLVSEGGRTLLLQLDSAEEKPLSIEEALPAIRQRLAATDRGRRVAQLLQGLRAKARVQYEAVADREYRSTRVAEGKARLNEPTGSNLIQSPRTTLVR